jgi:hypothetical protein
MPLRPARALVLAAALLLAAGCDAFEQAPRIVDGWAIGDPIACPTTPRCELLATVALAELDRTEPGHAALVTWSMHHESWYTNREHPDGKILATRSGGCCRVWLAELADGRSVAIGVGYPGVSQEPVAVRDGPAEMFARGG